MNKQIINKLKMIQEIVRTDISYMSLALLKERQVKGCAKDVEEVDNLRGFLWLKSQFEYMRFVDILFWVNDEKFEEHQNDIIMYKVPNKNKYICIGEVEPYPILLNKENGKVYCIISELGERCDLKEYNNFEEFFNQYVIGEKYLELGSIKKWYDFMKEHEII